jgi:hypothetical protein
MSRQHGRRRRESFGFWNCRQTSLVALLGINGWRKGWRRFPAGHQDYENYGKEEPPALNHRPPLGEWLADLIIISLLVSA